MFLEELHRYEFKITISIFMVIKMYSHPLPPFAVKIPPLIATYLAFVNMTGALRSATWR
jgi:hypothetical protein